ncbi:MAG: glycosyltransferase [Betaproteobacteria bacterium]|nr:glycosyltransferase [Betaproteobacteria bacterium]
MNTPNKPMALRVEGWRGVSHSYALVNQFQILAFLKHGLARVQHVDMPFIMAHWGAGQNSAGFTDADQNLLADLSTPVMAQAVYRIFAPLELVAHASLPTVTFVVTEFGLDTDRHPAGFANAYAARGGRIHTPSQWSKQRLLANGVPEAIIHVVPHAADEQYFYPLDAQGIALNRQNLGLDEDDVVLLNVGTHHWNKGLDVLLKSFAQARQTNRRLKLVLKDQRSTYLMNSESYVHQVLNEMGVSDNELMASIRLISGHLNLTQLNALYNAADAYVTPYRAEGFNLPALEAQSCGTPVVATRGGATDDFLNGDRYHPIGGTLIENATLKEHLTLNAYIEPNGEHLVEVLAQLGRKKAMTQVLPRLSWADVGRQLLAIV